jgi:hypothetical protein
MRAPFVDRTRRVVGWLLLTVGLLATSLIYNAFLLRALVLDPDVVVDATDDILERRIVQSTVADQIVAAAQKQLLPPGTTSSATLHITDDLRQAGIELTRTPEFHDAYAKAVRALHRYIFIDRSTTPVLDLSPLVATFRSEAIELNPAYATLLPEQAPLRVDITDQAPDLTGLKQTVDRRLSNLVLLTVGAVALAMLVHSRRPAALRRIGVWLVAFALLQGAVALLLPVLASGLPGNSSIIGEHLARSVMPRLIAPAIALMVFGIGALICARRWQRLHDKRNERTGASAFLDPDHLIKISGTGAPLSSAMPATVGAPVPSAPAAGIPPTLDPRPAPPRRELRRRAVPITTPSSPAPLFDPPETRSPPVDSLGPSISRAMIQELSALPTTHRVDD